MKRLLLSVLVALPLGCATNGSWISECDKDPDLRINIWGPQETPKKAPAAPEKTKAVEPPKE